MLDMEIRPLGSRFSFLDQPMDLRVCQISSLPPLSWFFQIGERAELTCGRGVEIFPNGFFEGAWAGDFAKSRPSSSANLFGSGAMLSEIGWLLLTPSHTLEPIFLIGTGRGWAASNSLAFLLAAIDTGLKITWTQLQRFIAIIDGPRVPPTTISTSEGPLFMVYRSNVLLGRELKWLDKPEEPSFENYEGYTCYLREVMSSVAQNVSHPSRRRSYRPIASISTGYDSPACAALAKSVGCDEAITFDKSRDGVDDSGLVIGEALGCRVHVISRLSEPSSSAEFFATGMQSADLVLSGARDVLSGKLFITGFHGDKVWDPSATPHPLSRGDISGAGLGEFRLATDFIHLPVPFVGAMRHAQIRVIGLSEEMSKFRMGGTYDRPIPRRITEEAGVKRGLFGRYKKAIHDVPFRREAALPEPVRRAVLTYVSENALTGKYRLHKALYLCVAVARRGIRFSPRLTSLLHFWTGIPMQSSFFRHMHPINLYAFFWALFLVGQRYSAHLNESQPVQKKRRRI
jgi:hypothetical protein